MDLFSWAQSRAEQQKEESGGHAKSTSSVPSNRGSDSCDSAELPGTAGQRTSVDPTLPSPAPRPTCACGAKPKIRSVDGGSQVNTLRIRWVCNSCARAWDTEKIRRDVCQHGVVLFVPCELCHRTWADVHASNLRAKQ